MKRLFISLLFTLSFLTFAEAKTDTNIEAKTNANNIILELDIRDFNQYTGELLSMASFYFPPSIIDKNGTLKKTIIAAEKYTTGDSVLTIESDQLFKGFDSRFTLTNQTEDAGEEFLFPFDTHSLRMHFFLVEKIDNATYKTLPFILDYSKSDTGKIDIEISEKIGKNSDNDHLVSIFIQRPMSVKIFSIFINVVMLIISIFVLIMALRTSKDVYRPDAGKLGFIGGLLFAIPAVRSLQPDIPPFGAAIIDYFGFFESELILVIALIITMKNWLKKPERQDGSRSADEIELDGAVEIPSK